MRNTEVELPNGCPTSSLMNPKSKMKMPWCIVLAMLTFAPAPATAGLYVATNGNDSWSGKPAEPNAEKTDGPFASFQKARDAILALKKASGLPEGGVTVFVRGGLYELPNTLLLEAKDSGTESAPVVYRAYQGEQPVLTGTRRISGFVPHRGKILKADVAAQGIIPQGEGK